ncbi:MAG TPA: phospholipase D-like domain-containing protein [Candidatus Limnocylindria bacterium]|jgi:hypothetical protein|nr:phospholipase D-like domain-containing protein [Candidatus Limnocylindria bacterium]
MPKTIHAASTARGLSLHGYVGDYVVMLAWSLDRALTTLHAGLAGFSIERTPPHGSAQVLLNTLDFAAGITANTDIREAARQAKPSTQSPFQKFRWIDYPSQLVPGAYRYVVTAMYFTDPHDPAKLVAGVSAEVTVTLGDTLAPNFDLAFTRGFISSQAYAREFDNAAFRPADRSQYLFATAPFEPQYAWCGRRARVVLFDFLRAALKDRAAGRNVTLDAFVYDVDEPDFVEALKEFGTGLRLFLDDSEEKPKGKPAEPKADRANAVKALGLHDGNLRRGHFRRFAHDKVLIRRDDGKPTAVLAGSANYSIRGLYVQSNSVVVVSEPGVAQAYADAFESAFAAAQGQEEKAALAAPLSREWVKFQQPNLPQFGVSFAPHGDGEFALNAVAKALNRAEKNVVFALMSQGGGAAQEALANVTKKPGVYIAGTVQTGSFAVKLMASGQNGSVASYMALERTVPEPFREELNVGMGGGANAGQVIHHKFVVVDFNGAEPTVFFGSSNLASGGEASNGDNLMAVYDKEIATMFAIEGMQLNDHYAFRDKASKGTAAAPFALQGPGAKTPWYAGYYEPGAKHYLEMRSLIG